MAQVFDSPFVRVRPEAFERAELLAAVERELPDALALLRVRCDPLEPSLADHRTSARYIAHLGARGFQVETPIAGIEAAFVARHGAATAAFRVALLAEMSPPPAIGPTCDPSGSGPTSLLAAAALASVLDESAAQLVVVGTPCEAAGETEATLADAGVFDDLDCTLVGHAAEDEAGLLEGAQALALRVWELARCPGAGVGPGEAWNREGDPWVVS